MNLISKTGIYLMTAGISLSLAIPEILATQEMDEIAMKYIRTLSPEDQSSIGIKEMRSHGSSIQPNHNWHYLACLEEQHQWLKSIQDGFQGSELHCRELSLVVRDLANSMDLIHQTINNKFVTVLRNPLSDLLNSADRIFDCLNDLVLIKAEKSDIAARFKFYVRGNQSARPTVPAIQEELEILIQEYGEGARYPYIKYLEYIVDQKKLDSIIGELKLLLPTEMEDIDLFQQQMTTYNDFVTRCLMPKASQTCQLPKSMYELRLKLYGVDAKPEDLIERGLREFKAPYERYRVLANEIALGKGDAERYPQDNPAKVLGALIEDTALTDTSMVISMYKNVQAEIEELIRINDFVTLPQRPVVVSPGTDAEEAIMPIPHVNSPSFIGNDGTLWPEFVLCDLVGNSDPVSAYALTAHEGRPGHDLQFSRMVELTLQGKMNLFESVLSDNPTNVEGWAHYVEYAMSEHFPPEIKLGAMRDQLLRMARTFLDPQINLGLISHQDVINFQRDVVGFGGQTPKSEADCYSFKWIGQAVSYRYGAQRIMDLRDKLKAKMGDRFSLSRFHDALLSFGLMPTDLIEDFIEERM